MCPSVAVGGKAGLIGTFSCVYFYYVSVCINDLMQIKAVLPAVLYILPAAHIRAVLNHLGQILQQRQLLRCPP